MKAEFHFPHSIVIRAAHRGGAEGPDCSRAQSKGGYNLKVLEVAFCLVVGPQTPNSRVWVGFGVEFR